MHLPLLKIHLILTIDFHSLLFGSEQWTFLIEVALRTLAMFLIILFGLRILGKRSLSQLSVFELGLIIGLGSAAGDPMFYKDVGLLPGLVVFAVMIALYRFMTYLINRSNKLEKVFEGEPSYLIKDGAFNLANFEKEPIAHGEFFSQLRLHYVSHLGQIQLAILETNGLISVFFYQDEEVKEGLPILPHLCEKKMQEINAEGSYACSYCGYVEHFKAPVSVGTQTCSQCAKTDWVATIKTKRMA